MKVLWLTNSPIGGSNYINHNAPGRGWIASLGDVIKVREDFELAVCFFDNSNNDFKFSSQGVTYYPIKNKLSPFTKKIISKLFLTMWDSNLSDVLRAIEDYEPDIIQLFGTETGLGEIVGKTKVPIIIHIQGLLNPIISNWFPTGYNSRSVFLNSTFKDLIFRRDLYSEYLLLRKMAKREEFIIKNSKHFFGRTDWDKRIIKLYNSDSEYFFCHEVLRPFIYESKWIQKSNPILKLVTLINPQIYKGLDIVLETAKLLKHNSKFKFEWTIIGLEDKNHIVKIIENINGIKFKDNSVSFIGIKQGIDLISELLNSDIFIHPSHIDNSPNSVCEAMILGMPVIAGYVGGVSSMIENNFSGILYNSQDPFELAGIIIEKAPMKDELQKLGKNAREIALIRHNPDEIVTKVIDTYNYILKSN